MGHSSGLTLELLVMFTLFGYFEYGTFNGAAGAALFWIVVGWAALFGIIPIAGNIVQYWVMSDWLMPKLFAFTGIAPSWITSLVFWSSMAVGVLCSITVVVGIAWHIFIKDWLEER